MEIEVVFGDKSEEQYTGVCFMCGEFNGIAFIYPESVVGIGKKTPIEEYRKPLCINKECSNFHNEIDWVNIKEMENE